jgi:hypothetical protein
LCQLCGEEGGERAENEKSFFAVRVGVQERVGIWSFWGKVGGEMDGGVRWCEGAVVMW